MCRKCLMSANEEARRCKSCGGPIVRFDEAGEVMEAGEEVDEKSHSGAIPPLFAEAEFTDLAIPPTPQPTPPAAGSPTLSVAPPPSHSNPQTQMPPLLLPSSQIDDVVSEMLTPFGFERPAPAAAPDPIPASAPPVNVVPPIPPNLQHESSEEQQVRLFRSAPKSPPAASVTQAPAVPATSAAAGAASQSPQADQASESAVSMAELARDIFAVSDDDVSGAAPGAGGSVAAADTVRQASSDLIIGPAPKGGWLKRGKASGSKARTPSAENPQVEDDPMSELTGSETQTETQTKSGLRSH
jgi:hypothetical protein